MEEKEKSLNVKALELANLIEATLNPCSPKRTGFILIAFEQGASGNHVLHNVGRDVAHNVMREIIESEWCEVLQ